MGYFFTRHCNGHQLHDIIRFVLKQVESAGFEVVRIVTDNHKVNVTAMQLFCNGPLTLCIDHPADPSKKLFFAFDQCHIIKNVRSQFLARDLGKDGEISSSHLKELYAMQKGSVIKPVRFLTRKHVYPTNLEKMNVKRAVQLLSTPVTGALKYLQEQAGHTCDISFADAGPIIRFMEMMYRWFLLMDVSNCTQHIHQNQPDSKEYRNTGDERLVWLVEDFIEFLEAMKKDSDHSHFFSKETYEALLLTTELTLSA